MFIPPGCEFDRRIASQRQREVDPSPFVGDRCRRARRS
jgi:hypothetical protein